MVCNALHCNGTERIVNRKHSSTLESTLGALAGLLQVLHVCDKLEVIVSCNCAPIHQDVSSFRNIVEGTWLIFLSASDDAVSISIVHCRWKWKLGARVWKEENRRLGSSDVGTTVQHDGVRLLTGEEKIHYGWEGYPREPR